MWFRKRFPETCCCLILLLFVAGSLEAAVLNGMNRWSGQVELSESTQVARGATLTIAAGTRVTVKEGTAGISVQGRILIKGTAQAPVLIAGPAGWSGIELIEGEGESLFEYVDFRGGQSAISSIATGFRVANAEFREYDIAIKLLRESFPTIEGSLFIDNGIGVDNEMKSGPTIRNNRFVGHKRSAVLASHNSKGVLSGNHFEKNKQAVALLQKYQDRVIDNTFVGNEVGIYCNQTQSTPLIENNRFIDNGDALVNFSFSYPAIRNNLFRNNKTGVRNDQYGSPLVEQNTFEGNDTALYNYRKSNPKVRNNLFEANELAMFCDYSSYPEVKANNFLDNAMAVKLGIYQSADWEKRSGSKMIMQREAAARQTKNPLLANAPTEFNDFVDVTGNWWGAQTELVSAAGQEGNPAIFHDRKDQPTVVYKGFGPESYQLDRIVYSPWLQEPVAEVGAKGL
jgi:parallel beta-helix repeat protein